MIEILQGIYQNPRNHASIAYIYMYTYIYTHIWGHPGFISSTVWQQDFEIEMIICTKGLVGTCRKILQAGTFRGQVNVWGFSSSPENTGPSIEVPTQKCGSANVNFSMSVNSSLLVVYCRPQSWHCVMYALRALAYYVSLVLHPA